MKNDLYTEVTNSIIESIENGVVPWHKPWSVSGSNGLPFNFSTGANYNGINILSCWMSGIRNKFESNGWLTFKQVSDLGGRVIAKSKGTKLIFYKTLVIEDKNNPQETKNVPMPKPFTVFNLDQIEGIEFPETHAFLNSDESIECAEKIVFGTDAMIDERPSDRAFYSPSRDTITIPQRQQFETIFDFYATSIHELAHWTGNEKRLDRNIINSFGTKDYAFEELVAELTSCFLYNEIGLDGNVQHASYIDNWLGKFHDDKRYIFKAASLASKAADYIKSFQNSDKVNEAA